MRASRLHVELAPQAIEALESGNLRETLGGLAHLVNADLSILELGDPGVLKPASSNPSIDVHSQGRLLGRVASAGPDGSPALPQAAALIAEILDATLQREAAVADLADAMLGAYSELNLLYSLLPALASRTEIKNVGELLVNETARALDCSRVSLLILDEKREYFRVLAARGLPADVRRIRIPVDGTISGQAAMHDGLLVVDDISDFPDLEARSRGEYDSAAFAVIRVPLRAQGQPLGVLTVTERRQPGEFSAHDRKLLEALSAMGASALMNCRLHAAVTRQIMGTISALASTVDAKDQYTHDHSRRVAELCVATSLELGVDGQATQQEIELAGFLHDIGKIGIPDSILSKTARLTPEEFEIMKTHVQIGARIAARVEGLTRVSKFILHHHERWDGLGYPARLSGDAIPIGSRLIAVADAFDCITSDRPYRKGGPSDDAIRELLRCRGTHFDPDVVEAFCRVMQREPWRAVVE